MILETRGMFFGKDSFFLDFLPQALSIAKLLMSPKLVQF